MDVLKSYLTDKIDILYENIKKLNNDEDLLRNKLFEKKIEYMNNYLHNSIVEIEEINELTNTPLINDEDYVRDKLEEYKNIETTIDDYMIYNL